MVEIDLLGKMIKSCKVIANIGSLGTFNLTKAAVEHLKKSKGAIINVSATLHYTGTPFQQHAGAAKAAVDVKMHSTTLHFNDLFVSVGFD